MLHVHDQVAGRQRRQLCEEGVGALAPLLAADEAVAEHVLLGQHRHFGRIEAMVERQHDEGRVGSGPERILPALGEFQALEAMILEQAGEPFSRTGGVARQDHFLLLFAQLGDMVSHRLIDIDVLRRAPAKVSRPLDAEIDDLSLSGCGKGGEVDRPLADRGSPFLARQIELGGSQRAVASRLGDHRLFAVGEIILDRLMPGLDEPSVFRSRMMTS